MVRLDCILLVMPVWMVTKLMPKIVKKLLAELADVPTERRQAKFVSTIVLLQHPSDPSPIIAQGECEGEYHL